jgi:hypothetical protein
MLELTYSDEIVPETGNEPPAEPETLPEAEIAPLGEPVAEGSIREVGAA